MPKYEIKLPKFNPKQQLAFDTEATDILFGGATRGGKSFFVRRSLILWCSQIQGLQTDIFRLSFDDVIAEAMQGETSFPVLLNAWERAGYVKINQTEIKFWNGSLISLEHAGDPTAVKLKHQGIAKHVRVFMESTQIDSSLIQWLSAWVTMSAEMLERVPEKWKGRFPKIIHATNPIGPSSGYYRKNYIKARAPYAIETVGAFKRQYIPALVEDNPHENAIVTRARLSEIGDKAITDALLNANWDAPIGEFFPEYSEQRHVVSDFTPPSHWFRYRSMDIGWSEPAAVYWIAVSDGEAFRDETGKERWFPRGARVFYNEWYICDLEHPEKGAGLSNVEMAQGILERSELHAKQVPTLTDSKPFQGAGSKTPALEFQNAGVILTHVNTGPGSRVAGWSIMRSALIGAEIDGLIGKVPLVFFCQCCKYARDYIPALPRHPSESKKDDAAEHGEATHACDAVRYGLLGHEIIRDNMRAITEEAIKKQLAKPSIKQLIKGSNAYFN